MQEPPVSGSLQIYSDQARQALAYVRPASAEELPQGIDRQK